MLGFILLAFSQLFILNKLGYDGKLSGIVIDVCSKFYLNDDEDPRVRCVFTLSNDCYFFTLLDVCTSNAMIDSNAQSEQGPLTVSHSLIDVLNLSPSGQTLRSKGSNKTIYKPIRLMAKVMRGGIEEENFAYMEVGVLCHEAYRFVYGFIASYAAQTAYCVDVCTYAGFPVA
jgi:hypothetical protein